MFVIIFFYSFRSFDVLIVVKLFALRRYEKNYIFKQIKW